MGSPNDAPCRVSASARLGGSLGPGRLWKRERERGTERERERERGIVSLARASILGASPFALAYVVRTGPPSG